MKPQALLHLYEYATPDSRFVRTDPLKDSNGQVAECRPVIKAKIDFFNSRLRMEGDWQHMAALNGGSNRDSIFAHFGKVVIEAVLYPSSAVNLHDHRNDGLVFQLEGSIRDGHFLCLCSGLLVMENIRTSAALVSDSWNMCIYLYDTEFDECQLQIKLPLYILTENSVYN